MAERLWSVAGLCNELGVAQGSISRWRDRYNDVPPETHVVYTGQDSHLAWDAAGLKAWREWYAAHAERMAQRYQRSRRHQEKQDNAGSHQTA